MTSQDILTVAILLTAVMAALLFPGGPGTPRRFRLPSLQLSPVRGNSN